MTRRPDKEGTSLPELADRLREWLEELINGPAPEPALVPVPTRRPQRPSPPRRKRRR